MYAAPIKGAINSHALPTLLIPPNITMPHKTARMTPVYRGVIENCSYGVKAIVLVSTTAEITNAKGITKTTKRTPSHFCFKPSDK